MPIGGRLREERERLGFNQTDFGAIGGVGRKSQFNYEENERQPDSSYLEAIAAIGADVRYIITGEREGPAPEALSADERQLLALFRAAPLTGKAAAIGALQGAVGAGGKISQQFNAPVSGGVAGRNIVNKGRKKPE